MLLNEIGEFGFIDGLSDLLASGDPRVLTGIGDDCAVLALPDGRVQVVTTDALVEGVHFLPHSIDPERLGHKALAVSLSDVAAMGATPEAAVVTIATPVDRPVEFLRSLYRGMRSVADRHGVSIVGGDTTRSNHEFSVGVTVLGTAPANEVILRSGAHPGDALLLAGVIGESGAGLETLLHSVDIPSEVAELLQSTHLAPEPLVDEGRRLATSGCVTAMLDVSDGIASDVRHICRRSGVGARVEEAALPVTPALATFLAATHADPLRYLTQTGEDYALLFTASPDGLPDLMRSFRATFDTPLARIGTVTSDRKTCIVRRDDSIQDLTGGHDHFST